MNRNTIKGCVAWLALCCSAIVAGACSGDVELSEPDADVLGEVQQASCSNCPHICISGQCIDTQNDPDNCGLNPMVNCAYYEICVQGVCDGDWVRPGEERIEPQGDDTTTNCGPDYTGWCADPDEDGVFRCIDLENDPEHCGPDNVKCAEGEICEHGKCALDVGMPCNPEENPGDYKGESGTAVHCYTGKAGALNPGSGSPGDRWWNELLLRSYELDTVKQLECCSDGEGGHVCVDILDDTNCGECGGADCLEGEGPNNSCAIDPDNPLTAPFCACTWPDLNVLAQSGGADIDGAMQFEVCDTARADACISNGAEGPSIGCGCGDGPASRSTAATCASGVLSGCTLNTDCPFGQVCDTSGTTGECKVVGCNSLADCTGSTAISADPNPLNVAPSGMLPGGLRCTKDSSSTLNIENVTAPPAGFTGICIDISTDPAYCLPTNGGQTSPPPFVSLGEAGTAVDATKTFCGEVSDGYRDLSGSIVTTKINRAVPKTVDNY